MVSWEDDNPKQERQREMEVVEHREGRMGDRADDHSGSAHAVKRATGEKDGHWSFPCFLSKLESRSVVQKYEAHWSKPDQLMRK